jgi:hypothetical protein
MGWVAVFVVRNPRSRAPATNLDAPGQKRPCPPCPPSTAVANRRCFERNHQVNRYLVKSNRSLRLAPTQRRVRPTQPLQPVKIWVVVAIRSSWIRPLEPYCGRNETRTRSLGWALLRASEACGRTASILGAAAGERLAIRPFRCEATTVITSSIDTHNHSAGSSLGPIRSYSAELVGQTGFVVIRGYAASRNARGEAMEAAAAQKPYERDRYLTVNHEYRRLAPGAADHDSIVCLADLWQEVVVAMVWDAF